jgi:hypothetical protein
MTFSGGSHRAVDAESEVFWDVTLCGVADRYQCLKQLVAAILLPADEGHRSFKTLVPGCLTQNGTSQKPANFILFRNHCQLMFFLFVTGLYRNPR